MNWSYMGVFANALRLEFSPYVRRADRWGPYGIPALRASAGRFMENVRR